MLRRGVLISAMVLGLAGPVAGAVPAAEGLPSLGPGFLWGVAASGFQSEGSAPDSNWRRYSASGRAEDPYRNSVDFRHRYREDIQRAKALGVRVYRIGIEWARVQPRSGVWDFAYYDKVIAELRAAGIRPMLTLDHWVYPGWAADRGGWRNPGMVGDWLANMRRVVDRYARFDPLWVTVNEPAAYVLQETRIGALSPVEAPMMFDRLVAVHRAIYDYIHARQPNALVTSNVAFITAIQPVVDHSFEDRITDKLDFIGIDFYYGGSLQRPPGSGPAMNRPWDTPLEAEGIYYALRQYAGKFPGRPLYIVENGMPTENARPRMDGYRRGDNLRDTVYWLQRAKADGMNLIGYNYWSLTDNYEWGSYAPRFGLYTVNVQTDPTLTRRPTDAVAAYRDIIAHHGVGSQYRPTRPPGACSLVAPPASCANPVR